MNSFFAALYESILGIYDSQYSLIFDTLYNNFGGYNLLGLTFIFIPFIMFFIFYRFWKYPYGKFWHWILWLLITFILVGIMSWGIFNNEIFSSNNQELIDALVDSKSGYAQFANTLPLKYALINGLLGIVVGFLLSLILKQFSKIQIHLPF